MSYRYATLPIEQVRPNAKIPVPIRRERRTAGVVQILSLSNPHHAVPSSRPASPGVGRFRR